MVLTLPGMYGDFAGVLEAGVLEVVQDDPVDDA